MKSQAMSQKQYQKKDENRQFENYQFTKEMIQEQSRIEMSIRERNKENQSNQSNRSNSLGMVKAHDNQTQQFQQYVRLDYDDQSNIGSTTIFDVINRKQYTVYQDKYEPFLNFFISQRQQEQIKQKKRKNSGISSSSSTKSIRAILQEYFGDISISAIQEKQNSSFGSTISQECHMIVTKKTKGIKKQEKHNPFKKQKKQDK